MADAGASQRRGLNTTLTRTGQEQTLLPDGGRGESYFTGAAISDGTDTQGTRRAVNSPITTTGFTQPLPGPRGGSYVTHIFGTGGTSSQPITDRPSLNSKTPGPDRILPPITSATTHYKMRARDPDCPGIVYRTWVVQESPDFAAAQYVGLRCGVSALVEVVVVDVWFD